MGSGLLRSLSDESRGYGTAAVSLLTGLTELFEFSFLIPGSTSLVIMASRVMKWSAGHLFRFIRAALYSSALLFLIRCSTPRCEKSSMVPAAP